MAFISLTRLEITDDIILGALNRVRQLKASDFEESDDLTNFMLALFIKKSVLLDVLGHQLMEHNAVINNKGTLFWSFPVPADETAFNLKYDPWKAVSMNIFGEDGFKMSDFSYDTDADPADPGDVTLLSGIVTITNTP